jgi:TolB-like protein
MSENQDQTQQLKERISVLSKMLIKSFGYADVDPDTFLLNARKTTETICKFIYNREIGEEQGKKMMLNDYGRALLQKKVIPEKIGILIGTIQTYGNYGAHAQEDFSETSREWIAPCQTALANLTNWFFLNYLQGDIPAELTKPLSDFSENETVATSAKPKQGKNNRKRAITLITSAFVVVLVLLEVFSLNILVNRKKDEVAEAPAQEQETETVQAELTAEKIPETAAIITKSPNAQRLAILYFDNTGGENEMQKLSKGLADMLISDLSKFYMLEVVEREKLESILAEQDLSNTDRFDEATAAKIGKLLGAEIILTGAYFNLMGSMRIDARIIDVETGKVMKSEGVDGAANQFFALQRNLATKLITGLEVSLEESEDNYLKNNLNEWFSMESGLIYSEALNYLDSGNKEKAKELLQQVLDQHPDFEAAQRAMKSVEI